MTCRVIGVSEGAERGDGGKQKKGYAGKFPKLMKDSQRFRKLRQTPSKITDLWSIYVLFLDPGLSTIRNKNFDLEIYS